MSTLLITVAGVGWDSYDNSCRNNAASERGSYVMVKLAVGESNALNGSHEVIPHDIKECTAITANRHSRHLTQYIK